MASIVANTLPPKQREDEVTVAEYAAHARGKGVEMTDRQARYYLSKLAREGKMQKRYVVVAGKQTAVYRMVSDE